MTRNMRPAAIMVCVGYDDLLAITLPWNRHHFTEMLVVTSKEDQASADIAFDNGAKVYRTNAFYEGGATFNKWKALEEGLDKLGRHGWLCITDADVLWPQGAQLNDLRMGCLYSPLRHMFPDVTQPIPPEDQWSHYQIHHNVSEWAGYTQIFHADDHHLPRPPWHETNWTTAGGADSFFQMHWPPMWKERTPWNVLHLGPAGTNWCGRASKRVDGTVPPEAEARSQQLKKVFDGRRGKQGPARFDHEKLK